METKAAVAALSALAQESRLAIVRLLVRQGPPGMAAGDIARTLDIAPTTLSFHLAQLGHAGLVASRRDGRSIIYAADFARMRGLLVFLTEDCCQSDPAICAGLPGEGAAADQRRASS